MVLLTEAIAEYWRGDGVVPVTLVDRLVHALDAKSNCNTHSSHNSGVEL